MKPTHMFLGAVLLLAGCQPATGGPVTPQAIITEVFGPAAPAAIRVATCESSLNPKATSRTNDYGLFQINGAHRTDFTRVTGQAWSQVFSAYWNTVYAKHLYDSRGWQPWTCSSRA